ncbi:uncharacterized protein RHOBADRAFT_54196 [Rhodotorula graminis WP1]|uniref:Sensitive to high expression protein 9, mitochondrial n=1 Tax=Rhodotorula graminis (strain WP1) TaxID=578459 RepID=A0A194S185_RHOGW|nr:uncharacterized protein RHOBADRAFT_54196 [Rhodotorula graminis WP1]KPV74357.1 hypothetical protein RHOBADRAFT_54196 [Rhodotorula graminis WP1]
MALHRPLAQSCRACLASTRRTSRPALAPPRDRPFASSSRFASEPDLISPSSSDRPPSPPRPRASPSPHLKDLHASAHKRLAQARANAQQQLRTLLRSLDAGARKQAHAFAAALQALELERKVREVGGRINQATGYEEIERLRNGVGAKEKALMDARDKAVSLKQAYTERVKLRADSQREVNDLLQRKSAWTGPDVLRFTELVQQEHTNEQEENRAKLAMDSAEEAVEKGFSELMQAILERYHEEQVWSDKIRSMSTYGSLGITSLNVLLFLMSLLLIEPWRRRRLVENVEERLRENSQQGHDATQKHLAGLQELVQQAQATLDAVAASTAALAVPPPPPPDLAY